MLRPLGVFLPADDFISREDYKDGDLLEIDRKLYSHWVVSIGHDDVVNLPEATNNNCCVVVEHVPLLEVAHNCHVRVNNKQVPAKDRGLQDVSQKDVVNNALNSVGRTVSYNFFSSNSEHFVTRLKYGVGWSDQASVMCHSISSLSSFPSSRKQFRQAQHNLWSEINSILNTRPLHSPSPSSEMYQ